MLASMLGTIHNLRYYQRLTQGMRDALDNGKLMTMFRTFMGVVDWKFHPALKINV